MLWHTAPRQLGESRYTAPRQRGYSSSSSVISLKNNYAEMMALIEFFFDSCFSVIFTLSPSKNGYIIRNNLVNNKDFAKSRQLLVMTS